MNYGTFYIGEKINFMLSTHRFESGQKFNGVVKMHTAKYDVGWGGRTTYTMSTFDALTGIYMKSISASVFGVGLYWLVFEANIDLVNVWQNNIYRIENKPIWLLGMFK